MQISRKDSLHFSRARLLGVLQMLEFNSVNFHKLDKAIGLIEEVISKLPDEEQRKTKNIVLPE